MYPELPVTNFLLQALSSVERNNLLDCCTVVELEFGTILCEPDQIYQHVYFPLRSFISLVSKLEGHKPLEMGLIGNEGMLGATLVLGLQDVPMQAIVQGAGTAWRMEVVQLQPLLAVSPALQKKLNQYLYVLMMQLSQSAACAHFHQIEPRLARWLLMSHDRSHANHFYLTHQFLADMLGVRRSGVSIAAGTLQESGIIHYSRGEIKILNRKGLETAACECYQKVLNDYKRMLGSPTSLAETANP